MQNTLLDILILGLLVLLFSSTYRKWPTRRLRFWILGWVCVLAHFGFLLLLQSGAGPLSALYAAQTLFLLVGGVSFVLASSAISMDAASIRATALALSIPAAIYIGCISFDVNNRWLLGAVCVAGEALAAKVAIRSFRRQRTVLVLCFMVICVGGTAILWLIVAGHSDVAIFAILSELFCANAILYWNDFQRLSPGVITATLGLFAWSAVFPAAVTVAFQFPHLKLPPELWNVPKYFVEFGMVLTLLEEELNFTSRQSSEYRVLFDGNPLPMWIVNRPSLAFLKVNDAAVRHYGYSREQFLTMTAQDLLPPEDRAQGDDKLRKIGLNQAATAGKTHLLSNGDRIQVEASIHSIQFEGKDARFVLINDVTERERLNEQLLHQAQHDTLTGLPNRLLLRDRMEQALAAASRNDQKAAVVCIDLDRFKLINDTYGHAAGDAVLQQVAQRLRTRLRQMDTVARTGGEEFTIVLGGLSAQRDAETVAGDLLESFRQPFQLDGHSLDLGASLGVALYPEDGRGPEELWRAADAAMYTAKKSGGNHFLVVSREISESTAEAIELERWLRQSLKEGGLELYYQPQYTIDECLCGFEALVRLPHPRLGLVQPDRFIPVAEESGLIIPLGHWVIGEVCRQWKEWKAAGVPEVRTAVNVSPMQLVRPEFAALVQEALAWHGIAPSLIDLEITETAMMRNLPEVARQMRALSKIGMRFSVDDFGTGYSSLLHLHELPISMLKLDRSLTEGIGDGTYPIVEAAVSLAHSLQMSVVAEGVESRQQLAQLSQLGCDVVQGFLLSPPRAAHEIPALVKAATLVALRSTRS